PRGLPRDPPQQPGSPAPGHGPGLGARSLAQEPLAARKSACLRAPSRPAPPVRLSLTVPYEDSLHVDLLPGARRLLAAHCRALPQRDDLCGAFCGALALHAAGIDTSDGEPLDQDAVALVAGSA